MPESTCLHIQDHESGPIRVVDIPWISVRIGRAAFCEVRLTADDLADEACRLYRRGSVWHLVPVGGKGKIVVAGRSVEATCPLPFDVPFRVGRHCLTLRQDRTVDPDWQMYPGSAPADRNRPKPASKEARPELNRAGRPTPIVDSQRVVEASFKSDWRAHETARESDAATAAASASVSVKDRWQTRWRAAEAELKARNERKSAPGEATRPAYGTGFDSVPLREASVPRTQPREAPVPRSEPREAPLAHARPRAEPVARAQPNEELVVDTQPKREPVALIQPNEEPVALVQPNEEPVADTQPNEEPVALVQPNEEPVARAQPNEELVADTLPKDEPVARAQPNEELVADTQPKDEPVARAQADSAPDAGPPDPAASATVMPLVEPSPPLTIQEPVAAPFQADSIATTRPQPEPTETEVDAARVADLIEKLMAANPTADWPLAVEDSLEPELIAPPDDGSWYEIPVFASSPQKRRDRPRNAARKRTASERPRSDPDRSQTAASPSQPGTKTPKTAAIEARTDKEIQPLEAIPPLLESPSKPPALPSAKDILASHETRRRTQPAAVATKPSGSPLAPTPSRGPDQWVVPAWVAGPPAAALVLVVGLMSVILSWWWAGDSHVAALMSERLLAADLTGRRTPLPESISPPDGSWIHSTAEHLARWAIFMSFVEPGKEPSPGVVAALSSRALAVSPLNPTARLTLAQLERGGSDKPISPAGLGLSRDAASLTWSARRLLAAGNKTEALNMYVRALVVLTPAEPFGTVIPRFCDDPNVPRYLLPGEERQREILRELIANESAFPEWSAAIPKNLTTTLAAARLLKEKDSQEADALLDSVASAPLPLEPATPSSAVALAARAEAFALKSRWKEAEQNYRLAIESVDDERIKRSWWFNLADIELKLDDETQRQTAVRAALAVSPSDEISRRAAELQRANSVRAIGRATNVRAN